MSPRRQKGAVMSEDDESVATQVNQSIIMHDLGKGVLAGLGATAAAALLVWLKDVLGLAPEFNVIEFFAKIAGSTSPGAGWAVLLISGVVLGVCFAVLDARVEIHPSTDEPIRGVLFGVLIWL